jgi:hypothetical protein
MIATRIPDGTYFVHGECDWAAASYRGGQRIDAANELPSESDIDVANMHVADAVIRDVLGEDTDCDMAVVTRRA